MKDVHTEHCCLEHGCKYCSEDCTVMSGEKEQSFPCEECGTEDESKQELIKDIQEIKWMLDSWTYDAKDVLSEIVSVLEKVVRRI